MSPLPTGGGVTHDHVQDGYMRVFPSSAKTAEFSKFVREKCDIHIKSEPTLATKPTTREGVRHDMTHDREGA